MASAFYRTSREQWMADIRGYLTPKGGKRQTIRVPATRLRSATRAAADAQAFADECERYARILEGKHDVEDVLHALRLGVITQPQADALQTGRFVPFRASETKRLTIRQAAEMHPSTHRDPLKRKVEYLTYVDQFSAHAKVTELHAVTLEQVLAWVEHMRAAGLSWDTRRHRLLYLKRAFIMGRRHGIVDQVAGLRLDRQDQERTTVKTWALSRLLTAIATAQDHRIRAALALGGCLGLRPTEICRAQIEDLDEGLLTIGAREAKNRASRRTVPVPASVLQILHAAIGDRTAGALVDPTGPRGGEALTLSGLNQLLADTLRKGSGAIAPKDLRKTFATWATRVIPGHDLERYLGHTTALHAAVTSRSYLAAHVAAQLRPACALLESEMVRLMPRFHAIAVTR